MKSYLSILAFFSKYLRISLAYLTENNGNVIGLLLIDLSLLNTVISFSLTTLTLFREGIYESSFLYLKYTISIKFFLIIPRLTDSYMKLLFLNYLACKVSPSKFYSCLETNNIISIVFH